MAPQTLDRNLKALAEATQGVRIEHASGPDPRVIQRFFHLLLMECAERMTCRDFRHAVEIAREQLRRPQI